MSNIRSTSLTTVVLLASIHAFASTEDDFPQTTLGNKTSGATKQWDIPKHIQNEFPYYLSGYDFEGRPVFVSEVGRWNFRKYVELGGSELENLSKHVANGVNIVTRSATKTENEIEYGAPDAEYATDGTVLIVDMGDFDYFQMASPRTVLYMLNLARTISHLAELVPYAFIINVNYAAQSIINLAKPALGPLFDKFEFHGTNKARWIPSLLRKIPKEQLPEWYGGSKDFKPVAVYG